MYLLVTHTLTSQGTTHLRLTALAGLAWRRWASKLMRKYQVRVYLWQQTLSLLAYVDSECR